MPTDPRPLHNCDHESAGGGHCTLPIGHQPPPGLVAHEWCYCDDVPCSAPWLTAPAEPVCATCASEPGWIVRPLDPPGVKLPGGAIRTERVPCPDCRPVGDPPGDTAPPRVCTLCGAETPDPAQLGVCDDCYVGALILAVAIIGKPVAHLPRDTGNQP